MRSLIFNFNSCLRRFRVPQITLKLGGLGFLELSYHKSIVLVNCLSIVTEVCNTTKAEFVATTVCACQGDWMKRILKKLGHSDGGCTTMMCDNSSTIKISKNPVMHGRGKHIDVRFHFLRNLTKEGTIQFVHCGS